MRIRVWNAYASNNSGSYTIVGRLPSAEVAQRTAEELRALMDAQTIWRDAWDGETSVDESPLAHFCRTHALSWSEGRGGWDDWPEHSPDNRPRVEVSGTQIIVHHEYTVGLPPTFGELFYKQGGRVEHEERHAHHAIVVTAMFYWGWSEQKRALQEAELPRLFAALTAPDGLLAQQNRLDCPAAWRTAQRGFGEAPLTVGVVFDDLMAGVAATRALAETYGAQLELRLVEAASAADPLVHLRPSAPTIPRFDVVLLGTGDDRAKVAQALVEATGQYTYDAPTRLQQRPPIVIAHALVQGRADSVATALQNAGALVELRRNDA
jgi:hypothetical protein